MAMTLGHVHKGFNKAFLSVRARVDELLGGDEDLPLFITGHSLGGALATVATWYLKGDSLAACYTFGAPRVGDTGLMDRFRTPIYRVVNGVDPVPFVPPSARTVSCAKHVLRLVGTLIGPVERLANRLVRYQGYRHYGFQRYLNICAAGPDGDFPRLRLEFAVSPAGADRAREAAGRCAGNSRAGRACRQVPQHGSIPREAPRLREEAPTVAIGVRFSRIAWDHGTCWRTGRSRGVRGHVRWRSRRNDWQ